MADNYKYVIVQLTAWNRVVDGHLISIKESDKQIKTRAEYEQELAELIYKDVEQIVLETVNETTKWKPSEYFKKAKSISKKTVDRLFGEGE